jgi:hypothetical protein
VPLTSIRLYIANLSFHRFLTFSVKTELKYNFTTKGDQHIMMVVVLQNIGHFPAEKLEGNIKEEKSL